MSATTPQPRTDGRSLRGDLVRAARLADPRKPAFRDARYLVVTLSADLTRLRRWLPWGLRPEQPARVDLYLAHLPDNSFGPGYHEAGLLVRVRAGRRSGRHCPWMLVDDDVALILGRELLGYPKKIGEFDWTLTAERVGGAVRRRGTELLRMSATLGDPIAHPQPLAAFPHRNVATLIGPFLPWVVGFAYRETPLESRHVHDLQLTIAGSEWDPLDQLGLGEVIEARYHRADIAIARPPVPMRPLTPLFTATRLRPRVL